MKRILFSSLYILLICLPELLRAQESFFSHLSSHPAERITLSCQWDSLISHKDDSSWDASMRILSSDTIQVWKTEVTVRGKFRRSHCAFPPLELNLKKGQLRDRGMLEFDKLKLVTHCNAEETDPSDLYEELLVYRLYGMLTPYAFKVTPLRVDYLYPNGKAYKKNAHALLLEPTSEVTNRLGEHELEMYGVTADSLNAVSYCRNALFQFMIGNCDWDPVMQRNVKMIGKPGDYHVVPYDFDFCAIVYPSYGRLPSELGLKDFRDRIYLGSYYDTELHAAIAELISKKTEILDYVSAYAYLNKSRKREITTYLEDFFMFISEPSLKLSQGTILPYRQN